MVMKNFFNKRFEEEVLLNEKLRTTILMCMFLFAMIYTSVNLFIMQSAGRQQEQIHTLKLMLAFQFFIFCFEVLAFTRISFKIKSHSFTIPHVARYINSFIEILSPGVIILILSKQFSSPLAILHAPVVYLYFIFIILSTLRLDFKLPFFTGLLAAVSFFLISRVLIYKAGGKVENEIFNDEYTVAFARSMVLLLSGVGAAFVARQIRITINRSLAAAEAGNKIVNLFGQQISKEIVDEMLESEGTLQSKLMKVCVMFIDIRNFTKHVSNKTPGEIVEYQNAFFEIIINAVTKHNGIINQFLGDGCMVTFGAPVKLNNPAQHAVNAAIEIHENLNKQIKLGNIAATSIGIGIHVGDAVTGNIGTMERQQYSITGSVVILAARIEQLNKNYYSEILVSEDVVRQVNHTLPAASTFLGKVDLKGWHHPLGIYKIA